MTNTTDPNVRSLAAFKAHATRKANARGVPVPARHGRPARRSAAAGALRSDAAYKAWDTRRAAWSEGATGTQRPGPPAGCTD